MMKKDLPRQNRRKEKNRQKERSPQEKRRTAGQASSAGWMRKRKSSRRRTNAGSHGGARRQRNGNRIWGSVKRRLHQRTLQQMWPGAFSFSRELSQIRDTLRWQDHLSQKCDKSGLDGNGREGDTKVCLLLFPGQQKTFSRK